MLEGRAWSGQGEIVSVDVSDDGGATWAPPSWASRRPLGLARLDVPLGAGPGSYELCCRARDSAGNEQPGEPPWNLGGYANNAVQRVPVTVV